MFNTKLQEHMDYYDKKGYVPPKVIAALILGTVVAIFTIRSMTANETIWNDTSYDVFSLTMMLSGIISLNVSVFTLHYIVDVILSSVRYLRFFEMPKQKENWLSFKLDTLFDVTLKNPIFHLASLSAGHFAGIYARYTVVDTIGLLSSTKTMLAYYFTYVKFPLLMELYGIGIITVVYALVVLVQKPLIRLVAKKKDSAIVKSIFGFLHQVLLQAKKKSLIIVYVGLLPSLLLTLHTLGILPENKSLLVWAEFYVKCALIAYPLTALVRTIAEIANQPKQLPKQLKEEDAGKVSPFSYEEIAQPKQRKYETVAPITLSAYIDYEIQEVINEINQIVHDVNPYLELVDIEETHVLKRITEHEIVNLINHYNKLSSDTKENVKEVLLARLHSAKEVAKEISEISHDYHYDAFQKQAHLMDKRYNDEEKNA